jgi:hypothetical protein
MSLMMTRSCRTLTGDDGIGRIGERGKKKSAVKRYKATLPYFRAFCVAEGRAVADAPVLIEGSGPSAVPQAHECGAFLRRLGELARTDAPAVCGDGDERKITTEIFDKAKGLGGAHGQDAAVGAGRHICGAWVGGGTARS